MESGDDSEQPSSETLEDPSCEEEEEEDDNGMTQAERREANIKALLSNRYFRLHGS